MSRRLSRVQYTACFVPLRRAPSQYDRDFLALFKRIREVAEPDVSIRELPDQDW
jgi:hypothetical protein